MLDLTVQLAAQLRAKRKDLGLTQGALAQRSGLSRQMILRLERGGNLGVDAVLRVAAAMGCSLVLSDWVRPTFETAYDEFFPEDER